MFGGGNAKDKVNLPRDLLCLTVDTAAEPGAGLQWSTIPTSAGIGPAGKSAALLSHCSASSRSLGRHLDSSSHRQHDTWRCMW